MNTPQLNNKVSNKVEALKKKAKKTVRGWKFRLIAILIGIMGALYILDLVCRNITAFTNTHKIIRQPILQIKIQWPYKITPIDTKKKEKSSNEPKNSQILAPTPTIRPDFKSAYDRVWQFESNRGNDKSGLNGYCLAKNMLNEIGYAPHENYCFKDRAEQEDTFYLWLTNRLNHLKMPWCDTINECLINYSSGSYGL